MTGAAPVYAFVRCEKLYTPASLAAAEKHGEGKGATAKMRRREDATARALAFTRNAEGAWQGGVDSKHGLSLRTAHETHLKRHRAGLRKNSPRALHLLVGVSPEWIDGDPHDPRNPQVVKLVTSAAKWAEHTIGGTFAIRYDIDEAGSAVVDVFVSPVHESRGKNVVSTHKSLAKLRDKHRRTYTYAALQDSWAQFAQRTMDPMLLRGRYAKDTGREHLTPERYKAVADQHLDDIEQLREVRDKMLKQAETLRDYIQNAKRECGRLDQLLKKKPWLSGAPHSGQAWQPETG